MRLKRKKKRWGLTYAAITLIVITLSIIGVVFVAVVGMLVVVVAPPLPLSPYPPSWSQAWVSLLLRGGGDSPSPSSSPYPLI